MIGRDIVADLAAFRLQQRAFCLYGDRLICGADLQYRVNPKDPLPPDAPRSGKKQPLPPLEWYYPVTRLKPGAEVFLLHPTARTPAPDDNPLTDAKIDVICSVSEEMYFSVAEAQAADIDRAVSAARDAFDNGPWPRITHAQRAN